MPRERHNYGKGRTGAGLEARAHGDPLLALQASQAHFPPPLGGAGGPGTPLSQLSRRAGNALVCRLVCRPRPLKQEAPGVTASSVSSPRSATTTSFDDEPPYGNSGVSPVAPQCSRKSCLVVMRTDPGVGLDGFNTSLGYSVPAWL